MGGPPKLEIIQLITIGTSLDDPDDLDSSGVLRLGRVNDLNSWTIRLSNLEFDTVPSTLNVDITASGTQRSVELTDKSGGSGRIYEGSISSSDPILATEPDAQYSFHDINGIQDKTLSPNLDSIETFDQLYRSLSLFLSSSRYPYGSNLRRLGLLEYLTSAESKNEKRSIAPGSAFANKQNFAKLSFEDVDFSFQDPRATNLSDSLEATVKTKNRVGLIYAVVHGGQDGGLQLSEFRSSGIWSNVDFFPSEINASDVVGLKTLILASCGALNVHDYNNQMTSPQTPLANRTDGGLKWWNNTRWDSGDSGAPPDPKKGTLLLGYNVTVDKFWTTQARRNYKDSMIALKASGITDSELQQFAWLTANLNMGGQGVFACALDEHYYYYISYDVTIFNSKGEVSKAKFVKVPLADIRNISPLPYQSYQKGVPSGATEFSIPEVNQ